MDRTRKIAQTDLRKNVRGLAEFAVTVLLGLCELKSGVRVLPLCVLIALGKPRFPVFAGAFLSSVLTANGLYLHTAVIMTVYGLEWLLDKKDICPAGRFKIMLACAASLIIAVGEATRGNLIFEDILRSALVFIFIPFSVAALEGVTNPAAGKMRRELGVVTAVFMAVKGAGVLSLGGYSLGSALAAFVTLYLSQSGFAFGSVCGFVCGMGCGISYMPMMGIMGFCYGMFRDTARLFAVIFSYVLSGAVNAYLLGFPEALPGLISTLVGAAAYVVLEPRLPPLPLYGAVTKENNIVTESRLSAVFSSLSKTFTDVGRENAKIKKDCLYDKVSKNVFTLCEGCRGCSADKFDLANSLTDTLWNRGLAVFADLPKHIQASCVNSGELIHTANASVSDDETKAHDGMNRLAEEYLSFSRLICSANRIDREKTQNDSGKSRRVRELLRDKGIAFKGVSVTGKRRLKVTVRGVEPSAIRLSAKEISYMLSTLLTARLSEPEFVFTENGTEMRLESVPAFRVECAKAMVGKEGETVCGDTVSFFEGEGGLFYSLISDGMGSGREAELASRLASIFLEKLLTLGAEASETLRMLNSMLITKDEEVFTTVDLLEIDRMTGEARMIKAGAAPTFIYRGGECYRLDACTAPVGIISEVRAAETKLKLKKGDFIVMTSDGITPPDPKPCLPKTGERQTAAALATAIMNAWSSSAVSVDDMSVSIIKIA